MKHILNALLMLVLSACSGKKDPNQDQTAARSARTKIAVLLPLTGPQQAVGKHIKNAVQMAVFDGPKEDLTVTFYDTKDQQNVTRSVATQALQDGSLITIGPVFADTSSAAYEILSGKVPILSLSNKKSLARKGLYPMGFYIEDQLGAIFEFLSTNGNVHAAVIVPQSEYGDIVSKFSTRYATQHNMQITILQGNTQDQIATLCTQINDSDSIDTILITDSNKTRAHTISRLGSYGINFEKYTTVFTNGFEDATVPTIHLKSAYICDINAAHSNAFQQQYAALYGTKSPFIASLAYDAFNLCAMKINQIKAKRALNGLDEFKGIHGSLRLQSNGLVERDFIVRKVSDAD